MASIMTPTKTRTTEEVFNSHREAIENVDFDQLAADYAEDAILVTLDGSHIGREAILTEFFQKIQALFPDMKIKFEKIAFEGELCLLQWSAEASAVSIPAGIGVFFIRNGLIRQQAEWFQMVSRE